MTIFRETKIWLILALLAAGASWYVFQEEGAVGPGVAGIGEKALPSLQGHLDDIDQLVLDGPEGRVTLHRENGKWLVSERGNFPADPALVSGLLGGLGAAVKFTPKTAEEKFFDRLGLNARFVNITAAGPGVGIPTLKTGDQFFSPTGEGVMTFAFDPGTGRAWALSGLPEISLDPAFWVDKDLLTLSELRLKRLEVTIGDNPAWVISKETPMGPGFLLEGPDGARANARSVNNAALAATELTLDDVLDAGGTAFFKVGEARYKTFDGLTVLMTFYDNDGLILTALEASYDESVLNAPGTPDILPDAPPDGALEAANLNRVWQGRLFQIPLNQLAAILRFRTEFFKKQN